MKLCRDSECALLTGVPDRNVNQISKTPRIYDKAELAHWVQQRMKLEGMFEVTVVGPAELLLN